MLLNRWRYAAAAIAFRIVAVLMFIGAYAAPAWSDEPATVHVKFEVKSEHFQSNSLRYDLNAVGQMIVADMQEILSNRDYAFWTFQTDNPDADFALVLRIRQIGHIRRSGSKFDVQLLSDTQNRREVRSRKAWIEPGDELPHDTEEIVAGVLPVLSEIFDEDENALIEWLKYHVPLTGSSRWLRKIGDPIETEDEMEIALELPEETYGTLKNSLFNVIAIEKTDENSTGESATRQNEYKLTAVGLAFFENSTTPSGELTSGLAAVVRARNIGARREWLHKLDGDTLSAMLAWSTLAVYWCAYVPPGASPHELECE